MEQNSEELINQTYIIVKKLENKAKIFGNSVLVLSALDCLFGILAIFCSSLTIISFFASATSLTTITICGRIIQLKKLQQLEKSLKPLNLVAITWFINKYKKSKKGDNKELKTEKLSKIQIASICGAIAGIIFAIVSIFVPQITIAGDCVYNILISTGVEGICAFAGTFKGYTKRTEEEIAKIKEKQAEKEQKAIDKEALKEIKAEQKQAELTQAEQEAKLAKEKAKQEENELKAKQEAEYRAKIEEAKAKFLAEQNKTTQPVEVK